MRWLLPCLISLLSIMGLVTLRSVLPSLVPIQLAFVSLGIIVFLLTWKIGWKQWVRWRWFLYAGLMLLLVLTFLFASVTRGSASWLSIGSYNIQASQLAVPILSLVLGSFIAQKGLQTIKQVIILGILTLLPTLLILIAPDFGTAMILILSIAGMVFVSDFPLSWIGFSAIGVLLLSIIAWNFVLAPYQKARITSFISPSADVQGSGYNARQALIAVGSGQLVGRGLGQGVQSHLRFLPERQTDFIFASLSEEWGFVGAGLVLLLYSLIVAVLMRKAWSADLPRDQFYFLVATIGFVSFQILINIGMNMQLVPITGITLPFVSYGGSSFVSLSFHFGLVQSVITQQETPPSNHFG